MRPYSSILRIFAGALAILLFLPATILEIAILIKFKEMRNLSTLAGFLGALCGSVVLLKIALTRTSWAFFEQNVGGLPERESNESDRPKS